MIKAKITVRRIRWIYHALLCVGTAALALSAWHYFQATYYQAEYEEAFARLEAERSLEPMAPDAEPLAEERGNATSSVGQSAALKDLVGRLEIARIHLRVMVLKGADAASLRRGAGWIKSTASPGEAGNMGIAGHRDTHFRPLREVRKGDQIVLTTVDGRHNEYRVAWISVVDPSNVEVLNPTPDAELTLVTCYPFDYAGPAPRRFIVRAVRVSG